jgi:hypothetical protein
VGCDAPQKPPFTFPLCCDAPDTGSPGGTCVPQSLVPSGQQSELSQEECPSNAANYLCVPDEYLPTPTQPISTCSVFILGAGACVSKCVSIPLSGVFSQDQCPDNHICVACSLASVAGITLPGCN